MAEIELFIILKNRSRRFIPGSTVVGDIIVHCYQIEKINGITVTFNGSASVDWAESQVARRFTAKECYVTGMVQLLKRGIRSIKLQPGWHIYPFQFQLPLNIPSSFTGTKGKIVYNLNATLTRTFLKSGVRFDAPIEVCDFLDLNSKLFASAREPINEEIVKVFNCLLCSGPVEIFVQAPKRGYVPGENMQITFNITNASRTKISECEIYFTQVLSYHAKTNKAAHDRRVLIFQLESIAQGEQQSHSFNYRIPSTCTSDPPDCSRIISFQYYIELKMTFSSTPSTLIRQIPIYIGTVPISDNNGRIPEVILQPQMQNNINNHLTDNPRGPFGINHDHDASRTNNVFTFDVDQDPDSVSTASEISLPPAYENFTDLPPSYAEAITLEMEEINHQQE